jgi:hypothetical protein
MIIIIIQIIIIGAGVAQSVKYLGCGLDTYALSS